MTAKNNSPDMLAAALKYHQNGFSVMPCRVDKRPIGKWQQYTTEHAKTHEIRRWFDAQGYQSIGLVLGNVSQNVVVIDLDGHAATVKFCGQFLNLAQNTYSVRTGSGDGFHLYLRVNELPDNMNVRVSGVGGFEIRGNGQYVIAPPSPHPSGHRYTVYKDLPILQRPNLDDVCQWLESLRESTQQQRYHAIQDAARPTRVHADERKQAYLETVVSQEIARVKTASEGNRNNSLFYASLRLANLAAGGELVWSDMSDRLLSAAVSVGLSRTESERTIQSGWRIGSKNPRQVQ